MRSGTAATVSEGRKEPKKGSDMRSGSVQDNPGRDADRDVLRTNSNVRITVRDGRLLLATK